MKKILAVIATGAAALILAGCDGSSEDSGTVDEGYAPSIHYAFQQEVEPGKFVTCVWAKSSRAGGLSCDWIGYHDE